MIPLLYTLAFIAGLFAMLTLMHVSRQERHDRILLPFEQIRHELLDVTLAPRGDFSPREDAAARFLLTTVNGVIRNYHPHKSVLFDIRKVRRMIESDLQRYRETQKMVREKMEGVSDNPKIRKAYVDFVRATTDAFMANTPFIRTEIIFRWLWRDLAEQVKAVLRENENAIGAAGSGRLA